MVPVTVAHIGLNGYGIWSIILMMATYMQLGGMGVKSAFQKYVAEATGNGNYEMAAKLLSTGSVAVFVISVVALIPASIFSQEIASAAGVPPEFLLSSARAISMLALVMVLSNLAAAYEAIIMGAHRIDVVRIFDTCLCVVEAVGFVYVLRRGYGIFAMAAVMAASSVIYVICIFIAARRIVPQIRLGMSHVTRSVGRELVRFAGSYQLLSILQMVYSAVAPIAILRAYGARPTGVMAVASRLVSPVQMCLYAFVVPILSRTAMVYASGSMETMKSLLAKSFKATLYLTLLPLALISAFGTYLITAWVGQTDPQFQATLVLLSVGMLFQAFALLGLVLYRASGKTVMDNLREGIRITVILLVVVFAKRLGFLGVLGGMATAEFSGMLFMLFAISRTYKTFDIKGLLRETLKLATATAGIIAVGALATYVPLPLVTNERANALIRLGAIGLPILIFSYPILYFTGAVTRSDVRMVLDAFGRRTNASAPSGS